MSWVLSFETSLATHMIDTWSQHAKWTMYWPALSTSECIPLGLCCHDLQCHPGYIQPHTHMHISYHITSHHTTPHHTTPHHIIYVCVCAHVLAVFAYVCKARAPLMIHGLLEAQFSSKWWIIVNVYWCMVYLWFGTFISKSKQHLIFSECWHCVGCVCLWLDNVIQSHFNVSGGYVQLKMSNNYLWFITSLWLLLMHAYSPDQKYSQ